MALVVVFVIAMLGDDHNTIDGEGFTPQRQCFPNAAELSEPVLFNPLPSQIVFGELIEIDRCHIEPGTLPGSTPSVTDCQSVEKVLGMGVLEGHRAEERNFLFDFG